MVGREIKLISKNCAFGGGEKKEKSNYLLSDNSNFFKLGNFGKPFNDVKPTLIKLSVSNAVNSSVRPTIFVLRQLSKFSSVICKIKTKVLNWYFSQAEEKKKKKKLRTKVGKNKFNYYFCARSQSTKAKTNYYYYSVWWTEQNKHQYTTIIELFNIWFC